MASAEFVSFTVDGVDYEISCGKERITLAINGGIAVGKTTALDAIARIVDTLYDKGVVPFRISCEREPVHHWEHFGTFDLMGAPTGQELNILELSYNDPETYRVPMQFGLLGTNMDRYLKLGENPTKVPMVHLFERDAMAGTAFVVAGKEYFTDFEITMFHAYSKAARRALAMLESAHVIPKSAAGVYFQTTTETQSRRMAKRNRTSEVAGVSDDYLSRLNQIMDMMYHTWVHFDCSDEMGPETHTSEYEFYEPLVIHIIAEFMKIVCDAVIDRDQWRTTLRTHF